MKSLLLLLSVTAPLLSSIAAAREAYVPTDESEVLDTLPTQVFARRDGIKKLRRRLQDEPGNAELAATVADHYIGLGKSEGDPRFFGYARAAILTWWEDPNAPRSVLKVRAKLKETDHRYRDALADLEALLEDNPDDDQAWVEVANINRVLGDYAAASKACDRLGEPAASLPAMVARAPLLAITGEAESAYDLLRDNRDRVERELPGVSAWLQTILAEIARVLGRDAAADSHYQDGLRADPSNAYLKRSYADFLLDQGLPEEVLEMLGDDLNDNGALLRSAIAARMTGQSALAAEQSGQLHDRFSETRLRGDLPHGRFEARFELEFGDDPRRALQLAVANWERQKEIRDTRNVLEAAIAADDPAAAAPVLAFLKQHGTQDVTLDRLAQRLEDMP